jgi:glycosyltransferase involved in cell wall biosynthesis
MDYREHDKEIVFAGRFIKMKNIDSLIRAFQKFRDPNFKLVLIGDGPEKKNLENLVKSLNLEERIDFLPAMSQSDLYRRIAHCYVVVIPSWTDVSPNQAYECLSLGIPFLITKENYLNITADLPLTIEPGKIDDIAEKLNALLDEETYQKFNRALKQITISHPWERVVEEHLLVFRNVYHDRT